MSAMDTPPDDHGSDRYDYVEIQAPPHVSPPSWLLAQSLNPCQDCRANVFLKWTLEKGWHRTVAHDETCPSMTAMESDG